MRIPYGGTGIDNIIQLDRVRLLFCQRKWLAMACPFGDPVCPDSAFGSRRIFFA